MRDIRDDLQDRANLIAEQISTAQGQFDKHIEQLKHEHETMLEDLRSTLRSNRAPVSALLPRRGMASDWHRDQARAPHQTAAH